MICDGWESRNEKYFHPPLTKNIRRDWHEEQWYFSVIDVVAVLTDSTNPRDYWYRLKQREQESSGVELSTFCRRLKLLAEDGKMRMTDCASAETMFRIIESMKETYPVSMAEKPWPH